MDTAEETTPGGIWPITEIEATARDLVDVGIWEAAEEEERACMDTTLAMLPPTTFLSSVDTAPEGEALSLA